MRALQVTELSGPDDVELVELPDPEPSHMFSPGEGVVVEVAAAAVSFPEVLQSRGLYQYKPDLPFVPGAEVAGVVRAAPDGCGVAPGDRVAAFPGVGGYAELALAMPHQVFRLPDGVSFPAGAALPMNYLTVHLGLVRR